MRWPQEMIPYTHLASMSVCVCVTKGVIKLAGHDDEIICPSRPSQHNGKCAHQLPATVRLVHIVYIETHLHLFHTPYSHHHTLEMCLDYLPKSTRYMREVASKLWVLSRMSITVFLIYFFVTRCWGHICFKAK